LARTNTALPFVTNLLLGRRSTYQQQTPEVVAVGKLAGCFANTPPTVKLPPDPPSGEIRLDEAIPYEQIAEHLSFNTKSHMRLFALVGRVIQVHGPVWKVEQNGASGVLRLGSEGRSVVRANFADASDLRDVRPGQEVDVIGTFQFPGTEVILKDARLKQ
jgi:hypothetical protein